LEWGKGIEAMNFPGVGVAIAIAPFPSGDRSVSLEKVLL
jgi:hypothetical protein